jgi:hypothetical protein
MLNILISICLLFNYNLSNQIMLFYYHTLKFTLVTLTAFLITQFIYYFTYSSLINFIIILIIITTPIQIQLLFLNANLTRIILIIHFGGLILNL